MKEVALAQHHARNEQKELSVLDMSDNNVQAQITPGDDGVRMAKITPSDEIEGPNPPRNKIVCAIVPEVETLRTTIMASSEVNGMPTASLTVKDDEVSNLTQRKKSTGADSVSPCSSTAAQVNKCNASPIKCKPENNGGAKRKLPSIPPESGKCRTGGERMSYGFCFESRSELEHFYFMQGRGHHRRSGGKQGRGPNGAICTCRTIDKQRTELWLCTYDKCLFLGDMHDLFETTYGINLCGSVTPDEQELYVRFIEAHCSEKSRSQAQEKGLCKSASIQFHEWYYVNPDRPPDTGGLDRYSAWWILANESENKEEFNAHYDTRGKGKFKTGQDIIELGNTRTYNPVTTRQDKYMLMYNESRQDIISTLWFHPDGSAVGSLNWMHPQFPDTWWTDRGFQELTWDKYLTYQPPSAWAWCTCGFCSMVQPTPQAGWLLVNLIGNYDGPASIQLVKGGTVSVNMIKVAPSSGREQCSKCLWWGHDCTVCQDLTEVVKCGNKDLCGNCFLAGHGNSTCRFPGGIAADKARPEETYRFGSIIAMNERRVCVCVCLFEDTNKSSSIGAIQRE